MLCGACSAPPNKQDVLIRTDINNWAMAICRRQDGELRITRCTVQPVSHVCGTMGSQTSNGVAPCNIAISVS